MEAANKETMELSRETIVTQGARLSPSMGVLGRLQTLLKRADGDLGDIVELVCIDPALTFQVIKLANSALFGLRSRCASLGEAVARVGYGDIHQLVGLAVARQSFQGELPVFDIAAGRLWENAVAAATLGAEFAGIAGADQQNAYATGLLRNIGKVVLNNHAPQARYPGEVAAPDLVAWERQQFGRDSSEVAVVLLEHWRFAPETIGAVRAHRKVAADAGHAASAARLHLACGVIADWGCQLPGETTGWRRDEALLTLAGVPADQLEDAIDRARAQFAKFALLEWSSAT